MRAASAEALFAGIKRRLAAGFADQVSAEQVVRGLHAAFQAQFMSQGAYGGAPWAQLAQGTLRRRPGKSYMILVDSGDLRAALTEPDQGSEVTIKDGGQGLELSVDGFDYASWLQSGTGKMPARELITEKMLDDAGEQIANQLGDRLVEGDGLEGLGEDVLEAGEEGLEGLGGLL